MKMFVWNNSTCFRGGACGAIVVHAENVDEARKLATEEYLKKYGHHSDVKKKLFEYDINQTPAEETVKFFYGAE